MSALEALERFQSIEVNINKDMEQAAREAILAYNKILKKSGGFPSKLSKRALERVAYEARIWDLEHFAYQANPTLQPYEVADEGGREAYDKHVGRTPVAYALNSLLARTAKEMGLVAPVAFEV